MNHINNTENENRISMKPIEKKSLYLKISDAIRRPWLDICKNREWCIY